jgi:hypothetical protein
VHVSSISPRCAGLGRARGGIKVCPPAASFEHEVVTRLSFLNRINL